MIIEKESFICDKDGNQIGVVMPLERYEELINLERMLKRLTSNMSGEYDSEERENLSRNASSSQKSKSSSTVNKHISDEEIKALDHVNGQLKLHFQSKAGIAFGYTLGKGRQAGFVVLKGSVASIRCADSLREKVISTRTALIDKGSLAVRSDCYEFLEDVNFNSSSLAASLIAGNNRSGVEAWRASNERSLKELGFGV